MNSNEWKYITPRRPYKRKVTLQNTYWNGFDNHGKERWFAELSNGDVITSNHKEYYRITNR